jgi:acetyl-CoA C-acetyltransferase
MMLNPKTTPVIAAIGEFTDRGKDPARNLEPVALMVRAFENADAEAGGRLLSAIESVDLVGLVTWRYADPAALLCERLGIAPKYQRNTSMGGETPVRLVHEAALAIARGELRVAAITGGEAMNAMNHARKTRGKLDWTPLVPREASVRFGNDRIDISPISKKLGVTDPAQMYPLYEMALQASLGESPAQGHAGSAALWAEFAAVAAQNPYAWIQSAPSAETIATVTPANRLIDYPYTKLMVANPSVNQAAAIIVTSLAKARALGVPEANLIHIWGGAAASEPADYLYRDRYDHSTAQAAALDGAVAVAGGDPKAFDRLEFYSCFPVVPKLALKHLGLQGRAPTVTGGLTFFGGPLNNYMSHAICAMARTLRAHPGERGLIYGQGGFVSKHHTLVLSTHVPPTTLAAEYSVQAKADAARGAVPPLNPDYTGPATVETYSVHYARDGGVLHGVVVLRTPEGGRSMAAVPPDDEATLACLTAPETSAVGATGHVRIDVFGKPVWEAGEKRARKDRARKYAIVERDGHLTIVTINRPAVMNALTPAANAELAEIFDEFAADPEQWVAILTGAAEKAFSAGNDLKFTATALARGESIAPPLTGFAGLTARFDLDKPVIAAVNGVAMGGGLEIALACDIIVAAESAVFALPEPKVGLAALAGGLLRLPRQIGLKQAMGVILTGRRVSAAEGQQLGFVNEVVPAPELLAAARRWAAAIMECSPASIRASKQIVQRSLAEPTLAAAYANQDRYPATQALYRSPDLREGPLAFAEKRKPKWSNP